MVDRWDRAARLGTALGLAAMLAGCAGGGSVSPAPAGTASTGPLVAATTGPVLSVAPTTAPSPTADRTTSPAPTIALPSSPPTATLAGLTGGAATGALGSYTWAGGGSDSPWIPGKAAGTVKAGGALRATFGGLTPADWSAAWATVANGAVGAPAGGTTGMSAVSISAPPRGGTWSVRVSASFGPGANATYYWLVTVTP